MNPIDKNNFETPSSIQLVDTPFLLLQKPVFEKNIQRLRHRMALLGVELRPHLKTSKSIDAAKYIVQQKFSPITVSTLQEAEEFTSAGYCNILYAVGIVPQKLPRVINLLNV